MTGSDEEAVTNQTIGSSDEGQVQAHLVAATMETEKSEVQALQVKWDQKCEFWEAERRQWEGEITKLTVERVRWEMKVRAADEIKASRDADHVAIQQKHQQSVKECEKLRLQLSDVLAQRDQWSMERKAMIEERALMATNVIKSNHSLKIAIEVGFSALNLALPDDLIRRVTCKQLMDASMCRKGQLNFAVLKYTIREVRLQ